MNDRDVMNKIIAKIKALEDVISGGGGGGGDSGGSNVIQLTLTAGEEVGGVQTYVVSEDYSTVSTLISNGGYAYVLHNDIVYSFSSLDPGVSITFSEVWVSSDGVYQEDFIWYASGPSGTPLGTFDTKMYTGGEEPLG